MSVSFSNENSPVSDSVSESSDFFILYEKFKFAFLIVQSLIPPRVFEFE